VKEWYYADNNEQKGPVLQDKIIELLQNSEITSDSLVWSEGMPEWASAKDVGLASSPPVKGFHNKDNKPLENLSTPPVIRQSYIEENTTYNTTETSTPVEQNADNRGKGKRVVFSIRRLRSIVIKTLFVTIDIALTLLFPFFNILFYIEIMNLIIPHISIDYLMQEYTVVTSCSIFIIMSISFIIGIFLSIKLKLICILVLFIGPIIIFIIASPILYIIECY
jgi:hypothetical protein